MAEEDDQRPRCPECDSEDLAGVEGEYYSGVVAPDGGRERRRWVGYRCRNCGSVEEL